MKRMLTILFLALASPGPLPADDTGPTVALADFEILAGDGWSGSLSYLNYGSDERSSIPVNLQVSVPKRRTLRYAIQYPGEEEYNAKESLKLSRDGRELAGARITDRLERADGALVIRTLENGEDDNRPAAIEFVYSIAADRFSIAKNVRFEGTEDWFNRNEYVFER